MLAACAALQGSNTANIPSPLFQQQGSPSVCPALQRDVDLDDWDTCLVYTFNMSVVPATHSYE